MNLKYSGQKFRQFFTLPDTQDNFQNRILQILIWSTILFNIVYTLILLVTVTNPRPVFITHSILLAGQFTSLIFARKDRIQAAGILLTSSIWLQITFALLIVEGVTTLDMFLYLYVILIAIMVLGEIGAYFFTCLSLVSVTFLLLFDWLSAFAITAVPQGPFYDWLSVIFILATTFITILIGSRTLRRSLELARQNEAQLQEMVARRTAELTQSNQTLQQEIIEHKQTETALKESEERFRILFDNSPDAVWLIDPHHPEIPWMIVECNEMACRMNGYSREELIGHSANLLQAETRIAQADGTKREQGFLEQVRQAGTLHFEGKHRHKDGAVFPIDISATLLTIGQQELLLGIDRDITTRKKAEALLAQAKTDLEMRVRERTTALLQTNQALQAEITERKRAEQEREQLITELEAKNKELEQFTYTVSHDLKSPLISIRGFLGLLERDMANGDEERVARDVSRIYGASERMLVLLEDLLALSRIGRFTNPPKEILFHTLAQEVIDTMSGQIMGKNVRVDILAPPDLLIYGDPVRLAELLQNLVDNALKFMGSQPQPCIEIGAEQQDGEVLCYVRDNGLGIAPQYQKRIFNLFERLDKSVPGTGVGLALVQRIVAFHHGRIWVESAGEGQGATFYFTLPDKP
ncbi:MAG: PAS domain S-box protein [Chloroflexi bacterium]|nr:PAS domain S-box protein [Chloroflexota bacterium]